MPGRGPAMWRTAGCCVGDSQVTQVDIYQLYALGLDPDDSLGDELLAMVKEARNYVPRSAEEVYKAALLREYGAFCAQKGQASG